MKPSVFYRIAAVLLVLFAVGHTLGFRQIDPMWGVDSIISSMRSIHFQTQDVTRTYWDFYVGFGLFVTVLLLFLAVLAWQLGGLPATTLASLRVMRWALAICFIAITILIWRYFFLVPLVFCVVISLCLIAAAWVSSGREVEPPPKWCGAGSPAQAGGPPHLKALRASKTSRCSRAMQQSLSGDNTRRDP